ncbi:GNAT family N-acetyltransferase [Alkalibacillus haloalkaliphilus]|uniref:GNAT family N-acetyltransferase n=1 Tax=Alkalibacillus haloalkaliphilus TaxID=94136 RepID=UPI002935F1B8|nr:GNAT family N-acetyltransferase [Alkalibacillus haloalkaliphilus]MDV2581585.1 GNAT family N-acetyltransferase [Alkalibacillus haloalkaliphilus]
MIEIRKARLEDVDGIIKVCSDGHRKTYPELLPNHHIENIIKEFYNEERIKKEITDITQDWNGWFIAVDYEKVVGAAGGGFIDREVSELFVIYLDPERKREGIGSKLLEAVTKDQIERGAKEQWMSVAKDNFMGIPFYEAVGFKYQGERPSYELPEEGYKSLRYKRKLK